MRLCEISPSKKKNRWEINEIRGDKEKNVESTAYCLRYHVERIQSTYLDWTNYLVSEYVFYYLENPVCWSSSSSALYVFFPISKELRIMNSDDRKSWWIELFFCKDRRRSGAVCVCYNAKGKTDDRWTGVGSWYILRPADLPRRQTARAETASSLYNNNKFWKYFFVLCAHIRRFSLFLK